MSYTPNLHRRDVRRRVKYALGWAVATLDEGEQFLSQSYIDKIFGYHSNPLSVWLRKQLLITDNHYSMDRGEAKNYRLNRCGAKYVRRLLKQRKLKRQLIKQTVTEWAQEYHGRELVTGAFKYTQSSNRQWNSLQNISNRIRKPLFASYGYIHAYDIETAAPTIVLQYAKLMGLNKPTPTVDDYLENKTRRRNQLANALHVDVSVAKKIITALFNGAKTGERGSIAKKIVSNKLVLARLNYNPWIKLLIKDINTIWRAIGIKKSKDRWHLYFQQERCVMSAVIQYLKRQRHISNRPVRYFLEHDGWRSDTPVELYALSLWVKNKTGYDIKFSEEVAQENQL